MVSDDDEDALAGTWATPRELARGLAEAKSVAVARRLRGAEGRFLVIGCDSVLEVPSVPGLAGQALGKPTDAAQAASRWRLMRGQHGLLHTGHCLIDVHDGQQQHATEVATTGVWFAEVSDAEIEAYVASGEPLSVAGAFTIDGRGGTFIRGVDGDPSNVVGLSLPLLREMVGRAGVFWPSLWARG